MSYDSVPIGEICEVSTGQAAPQESGAFTKDGHPFVRAGSLDHLVNGGSEAALERISEQAAYRHGLRLFPVGTIVFAKSGMSATLDRVYELKRPCYVVSHLATLIPTSRIVSAYLLRWLQVNPPSRLIANSAYPSIRTSAIANVRIPLPEVSVQRGIAARLEKADDIRQKCRLLVVLTDKYLRSVFFALFGDPVVNSKGIAEKAIAEIAVVTTGNTPSRQVPAYYGNHIEWIKSDNLNTPHHYLTRATEGLSEEGLRVGRSVSAGSTLITCIAGSPSCIGNAALADRPVAFNQQINALSPKPGIEAEFLYAATLFSKPRIQSASTSGMKGMVSKGALEKVRFILPHERQRATFVGVFRKVISLTKKLELAVREADALYGSVAQRAFTEID